MVRDFQSFSVFAPSCIVMNCWYLYLKLPCKEFAMTDNLRTCRWIQVYRSLQWLITCQPSNGFRYIHRFPEFVRDLKSPLIVFSISTLYLNSIYWELIGPPREPSSCLPEGREKNGEYISFLFIAFSTTLSCELGIMLFSELQMHVSIYLQSVKPWSPSAHRQSIGQTGSVADACTLWLADRCTPTDISGLLDTEGRGPIQDPLLSVHQ
jgi:hypothetical protein